LWDFPKISGTGADRIGGAPVLQAPPGRPLRRTVILDIIPNPAREFRMARQPKMPRMLTHGQVWAALDRLAERAGLSPSGLARRPGLDPTTFNKSKRITPDGRERWPSTECCQIRSRLPRPTSPPSQDSTR
jgi:hypothetical protein